MKLSRNNIALLSLVVGALIGCGRSNTQSPSPLLPQTWIDGSKNPNPMSPDTNISPVPLEQPSPEVSGKVQATFHTYSRALEDVSYHSKSFNSTNDIAKAPWHLDGMVAAFAVDVGGVFGALVADGAPGVKVTWQQQTPKTNKTSLTPHKKTSFQFSARMTEKDITRMLEPAVRSAVATKSVQDVQSFRKNLTIEGMKFLSTTRVLSSIHPLKGWHVSGYQLGLFFNGSGALTPIVGVGGGAAIIFDWDQLDANNISASLPLSDRETTLQKNMVSFVQTMATLIPEAHAEASKIQKSHFELGVFQVGIGISIGGDIGVASTQGSAVGRVIFKKDSANFPTALAIPLEKLEDQNNLNIIGPVSARSRFQNISMINSQGIKDDEVVNSIPAKRFKNGIRRAIEMGGFFTSSALAAETQNWKVTEVEASFDAAASGNVSLVTVGGIGLIRLGFERTNL